MKETTNYPFFSSTNRKIALFSLASLSPFFTSASSSRISGYEITKNNSPLVNQFGFPTADMYQNIFLDIYCGTKKKDNDVISKKLLEVATNGDTKGVEYQLKMGANFDFRIKDGPTPLIFAAVKGHTEIVNILIDKGADVNAKDNNNQTPLMFAALNGHTEIAKILIKKGADVNANNNHNQTTLMIAAEKGRTEIVNILIDKGVDVNAKDNNNQAPLIFAAASGHTEIAKILIDKGADVNANNNNQTPLRIAAENGHKEIVNILIDKGVDVNVKGNNNQTPLICAVIKGHKEIVNILIDKGADVNAKANNNQTPLIFAAGSGHTKIAKILIDKGADVNAKDNNNQTALMLAAGNGHTEIAEILRQKHSSDRRAMINNVLVVGALGVVGTAGYKFWQSQQEQAIKKQEESLQAAKDAILQDLNNAVAPLKDILNSQQGQPSIAKDSKIQWSAKNDKITLKPQDVSAFVKNELFQAFNDIKQPSQEAGQKLFFVNKNIISINLDRNSEFYCPIEKNGNQFQIKEDFKQGLELIKEKIPTIITEEKRRQKEEVERIKEVQRELKNKQDLDLAKIDLNTKNQELVNNMELKNQLIYRGKNTAKIDERIGGLEERIINQKVKVEELQKLLNPQQAIKDALPEIKNPQPTPKNTKEKNMLPTKEQYNLTQTSTEALEDQEEITAAVINMVNPNSRTNSPRASSVTAVTINDDLNLLQNILLGQKIERVFIENISPASSGKLNSLFNFAPGCIKEENFTDLHKDANAQELINNFNKSCPNNNSAKNQFHDLLDKTIIEIRKRSGEGEQEDKKIRSRIYDFLNYCAGDNKSVEKSYEISEKEGQDVGFTKGEGHASQNTIETLSKLCFLLNQMQEGHEGEVKQLQSVTIADLDEFLEKYAFKASQNTNTQASGSKIISYFEAINDDYHFITNLLDSIKQEQEKISAPRQISDQTIVAIKDAVNDFIKPITLAMVKEDDSCKQIELSDLNKKEKEEKLKDIIKFSKNFEQEENEESKAAFKAMGAKSFKDFKDELGEIYNKAADKKERRSGILR